MNKHCPSCGYHETEGCQCQQQWWPKVLKNNHLFKSNLRVEESGSASHFDCDQATASFLLRSMGT